MARFGFGRLNSWFSYRNLKERDGSEDLGVDGSKMLKWLFNE